MSLYELLLFLHVTAATIWLGAGFLLAVLVFGAILAGDRAREGGYHRDVGWLAPRLFIPASLATLVLGLLLVAEGTGWSLDQLWLVIALCGWLLSFSLGFFYFKPEGERIGALIEQHGPAYPEVESRLHRLNIVDRLQLVVLFLMVADMTIKPTGDEGAVLAVAAAILIAALVAGVAAVQRGPAARAAEQTAGT